MIQLRKKEVYFEKLLSLTQGGLVSDVAQPKIAQKSLEKLKEEILINEGPRIKNNYMKKLGIAATIISALLIALYITFSYLKLTNDYGMYPIIWIAAMVGSWISFGARKFNISFEELSIVEEDNMTPYIRLIYTGLCSVLFAILLKCGIFKIELVGIDLSDIRTNVEIQIVVGALCGLIESKLGVNIYKKAVSIVGD